MFGLVIMNTAVRSSSLALQIVHVDQALGVALDGHGVEAGDGGAGGLVPWRCRE